jgi:hypothetical protein
MTWVLRNVGRYVVHTGENMTAICSSRRSRAGTDCGGVDTASDGRGEAPGGSHPLA